MRRHQPRVYGDPDMTPTGQEHRIARSLRGGHRQAGSGASVYARGDVKSNDFLVECKLTEAGSLRVQSAWLAKITRQALAAGKMPALAIEIQGGDEDPLLERDWVCVPMSCFKKLTEAG